MLNEQKVISDSFNSHCRSFGERLRYLREKLGLTQAEVARLAGIEQGYLTLIENNKRTGSIETWLKIGKALNIQPNYQVFALADAKISIEDVEQTNLLCLPANLTEEDKLKVYGFITQLSLERHKQLLEQKYPVVSALKPNTLVQQS